MRKSFADRGEGTIAMVHEGRGYVAVKWDDDTCVQFEHQRVRHYDLALTNFPKLCCRETQCAYVGGGNLSHKFVDTNGIEYKGEYQLCAENDQRLELPLVRKNSLNTQELHDVEEVSHLVCNESAV